MSGNGLDGLGGGDLIPAVQQHGGFTDSRESIYSLAELSDDTIDIIGTVVAISQNVVLTTWRNGMVRCMPARRGQSAREILPYVCQRDVYLVTRQLPVEALTFQMSDLVQLDMVDCNEDEGWCILKRASGVFSTFCRICPEQELPKVNEEVAMYDGLLACNAQQGAFVVKQLTRVAWYYCHEGRTRTLIGKKRKVDETPIARYEMVNVASDGSDIYRSESCPMINHEGKVFAFYTAQPCKNNIRHAFILCRMSAFKKVCSEMFPDASI